MRSRSKVEQRPLFGSEPEPCVPDGQASLFARDDKAASPSVKEPPPPVASRANAWEGVEDLETLRERILSCRDCALRSGAHGVVFGEGAPSAGIMFIGEGPGRTEDETGRPFVGRAGHLLDSALRSAGLDRAQVFISNIVKCRPPQNRLPLPPEVQACLPNLRAQMRIIRPKIVVLLGALASQTLVDSSIRVTRDRGKWFERDGVHYLVTFHPAAILRDEANKKRVMWEDFASLRAKWEEVESGK